VTVTRRYLADWQEPQGEEAEMPEDDTTEALPERSTLSAVMAEALALVLPDYPSVPDAEIGTAQFAAPGVAPMTDDDAKPLAGLAGLRDRMREDPTTTTRGLKHAPGAVLPRHPTPRSPGEKDLHGHGIRVCSRPRSPLVILLPRRRGNGT
jgi:hypothetical protein